MLASVTSVDPEPDRLRLENPYSVRRLHAPNASFATAADRTARSI